MESFSNDWDETFQYLSREMLVPEVISTDLQQVPTPPVRFGFPSKVYYRTNLTLVCSRKSPRTSSRLVPWRVQQSFLLRLRSFLGLNWASQAPQT